MLDGLTGSRILSAVAILMSSLGGRHMALHLDSRQEKLFQDPTVRKLVLFCILFLATRDLLASIIVGSCVLLVLHLTRDPTWVPPAPATE